MPLYRASSGGSVTTQDEGSTVVATTTTLNFTGTGVTASDGGGGVATVNIPGGGSGVDVKDEGSLQGTAATLNFVGSGVTATVATGTATVTIPGGAGISGSSVIDFGSFPGTDAITTVVTGVTGITATSKVFVVVDATGTGTADHSVDEHVFDEFQVYAKSIVAGTGFTIVAQVDGGWKAYGQYNVVWSVQ